MSRGDVIRCGSCGRELNLKTERFARRKIAGRYRLVCDTCASLIDRQETLALLRIRHASKAGRRAA